MTKPTVARWRSVKDELPEPGQFVLCAYDDVVELWNRMQKGERDEFGHPKGLTVRQLLTEDGDRWADEGVTHWMPLPNPPKEGD